MAELSGHRPTKQKVGGSIPGQGTFLGCGPGPPSRACGKQPSTVFLLYIDVSLLLLLTPSPPL